jgi:hypothetical protein
MKTNYAGIAAKDVYAEIGINFRYFLTWRQLIFAGYLAVLGALSAGGAWVYEHAAHLLGVVPAVGLLLTGVFWVIEYRNRQLYRACIEQGAACEVGLDEIKMYTRLRNPPGWLSQSNAMDVLFLLSAVMMLLFLGLLVCHPE